MPSQTFRVSPKWKSWCSPLTLHLDPCRTHLRRAYAVPTCGWGGAGGRAFVKAMGFQPCIHAKFVLFLVYPLHDMANVRTDPHAQAHTRWRTVLTSTHALSLSCTCRGIVCPPLQVKKATNSDPYGPAGVQLSDLSDVMPSPCASAAFVRVGWC